MEKIKSIVLAILTACTVCTLSAQEFKPVDEIHRKTWLKRIREVSVAMETLECDFVQRKTISVLAEEAVAQGKMYYRKANKMRWEYRKPDASLFVINEGKVIVRSEAGTNRFNANASRAFREISSMMLGSISGEQLIDEQKFQVSYAVQGDLFQIRLIPKNKKMKQMISSIKMTFSTKDFYIRSIEMDSEGGDITLLVFSNLKINQPLSEDLFK